MNNMKKHNKRGFTTLELLTVIGIISILAAAAVPSYGLMKKNVTFTNTVEEVVNTLRVAQNNATSSQDGKMWGVYFEENQYKLFSCNDETCSGQTFTATYPVNNGLRLDATTPFSVIFNRLFGTLYGVAVPEIINVEKGGGSVKSIQVDLDGKISS